MLKEQLIVSSKRGWLRISRDWTDQKKKTTTTTTKHHWLNVFINIKSGRKIFLPAESLC